MSRALDKDTVAALQKGDPEAAFCAIADVLTEEPPSSPPSAHHLEIEFLGRGHPPLLAGEYLLRDGNAVAIPKLALVQAFLVARKILHKYRTAPAVPATAPLVARTSADNGRSQTIWRATAVILLMDPEHLTAANTRKRLIQAALRQDLGPSLAASASSLLDRELHLVDSLLTSHLHRHTKSPTLWSHRRWLLSFLATPAAARQSRRSGGDDRVLQGMTKVVMVAAVRHPRNYYAWDHARWLIHWQQQASGKADDAWMLHLVVIVRDWCYRNHTDTSGWSFLFFLLASLPQPPSPAASLSPLYDETVAQVEQMAKSLRWAGEAVWVFLRTAVAYRARAHGSAAACGSFQKSLSALLATVDASSQEHQILKRAQEWCVANAAGHNKSTTT
ncbi:MAG: hypothetical protein STHCBS139747_005571 [Sporothrix thermara]